MSLTLVTSNESTKLKHEEASEEICAKIDHLEVARDVLTNEIDALIVMKASLGDSFTQLIDLICSIEGRVIVVGMGKSGHVARKIAATLASTGQPSLFVHPAEASHGDMGMITRQDLVLALSNSGETMELANVIDYTRRYSIPLVAITRREDSTLSRVAEISITLPDYPEACPMGLAPTTSTTMMLVLGDAIAVALLKARSFSPADFKIYHPGGSLGGRLHRVKDKMHKGASVPLVTLETPMSQVILTISEKSFGCVGVVDSKGALVGVVTDGDLRRHMGNGMLTLTAHQVMTQDPSTIPSDMLMTEALAFMNHKKITALFVVDSENIPVGVIHVHDFLRVGVV